MDNEQIDNTRIDFCDILIKEKSGINMRFLEKLMENVRDMSFPERFNDDMIKGCLETLYQIMYDNSYEELKNKFESSDLQDDDLYKKFIDYLKFDILTEFYFDGDDRIYRVVDRNIEKNLEDTAKERKMVIKYLNLILCEIYRNIVEKENNREIPYIGKDDVLNKYNSYFADIEKKERNENYDEKYLSTHKMLKRTRSNISKAVKDSEEELQLKRSKRVKEKLNEIDGNKSGKETFFVDGVKRRKTNLKTREK